MFLAVAMALTSSNVETVTLRIAVPLILTTYGGKGTPSSPSDVRIQHWPLAPLWQAFGGRFLSVAEAFELRRESLLRHREPECYWGRGRLRLIGDSGALKHRGPDACDLGDSGRGARGLSRDATR